MQRLMLALACLAFLASPALAAVPPQDVPKYRAALTLHESALRQHMKALGPKLAGKDKQVAKHLEGFYAALKHGQDVSKLTRADMDLAYRHLLDMAKLVDKKTDQTLQELQEGAAKAWGKIDQSMPTAKPSPKPAAKAPAKPPAKPQAKPSKR